MRPPATVRDQPGRHRGPGPGPRGSGAVRPPAASVLRLQRSLGNAAVRRLLARDDKVKTKPDPFAELAKARAAKDWEAAAKALAKLAQKEALAALTNITDDELKAIDAAAATALSKPDAERLHSRVSFVLHHPPDAHDHADQVTVQQAGAKHAMGKVAGGAVEVRTGVDFTAKPKRAFPAGFSIAYSGKDSERTRWLQFIWREVIVERANDDGSTTRSRLPGKLGSAAKGNYKLTTSPRTPAYNTDSASPDIPFYETASLNDRSAVATTIFDGPSSGVDFAAPQFEGADPARKVTSSAHFTTYLVRDMEVLYRVDLDVDWIFTDAKEPGPKYRPPTGRAATKLDPAHRAKLIEQYPDFDYLP